MSMPRVYLYIKAERFAYLVLNILSFSFFISCPFGGKDLGAGLLFETYLCASARCAACPVYSGAD